MIIKVNAKGEFNAGKRKFTIKVVERNGSRKIVAVDEFDMIFGMTDISSNANSLELGFMVTKAVSSTCTSNGVFSTGVDFEDAFWTYLNSQLEKLATQSASE